MAAKPAALSIHETRVPPKRLPCGLVSVGNTDSSSRASIPPLPSLDAGRQVIPADLLRGQAEAGGDLGVDVRGEGVGDAQQRLLVLERAGRPSGRRGGEAARSRSWAARPSAVGTSSLTRRSVAEVRRSTNPRSSSRSARAVA